MLPTRLSQLLVLGYCVSTKRRRSNFNARAVALVGGFLLTIHLAVPTDAQAVSYVFWTDKGTDKIQRSDLDGANITDLASGLSNPIDIALDVTNEKIYFTLEAGTIQRANLNGSGIENVITVA